jgi:DNA-binding transcriptional MerR regulator/methylmalonyl-CoA mutase cobalamin-binding subunit
MEAIHPIRIVAQRTGLSLHLIRMWERRYKAVTPERTDSGRRNYSEGDIERLRLLKLAVEQGEAIGQVTRLSNDDLMSLLEHDTQSGQTMRATRRGTKVPVQAADLVLRAENAIEGFDIAALEGALLDAEVGLSRPVLLEQFLVPLLQQLGKKWQDGTLRIVQEHFATAAIRTFLGRLLAAHPFSVSSPWIVVATPVGQLHELGAFFVALTAASSGWNVAYLGPNLPAEEIAVALRKYDSKVVGLSIIYPVDDPRLTVELRKLRRLAGDELYVIIGGQGAVAYEEQLTDVGVTMVDDLNALVAHLDRLRKLRFAMGHQGKRLT